MEMSGESGQFRAVAELRSMADTDKLGARIASGMGSGRVVAFEGDLGAGKTTLARAVLRALGVTENVPSPTFTLVQSYETREFPVRHFDLYRVETEEELDELGLDEALDEGAVMIEWPERAKTRIPPDALRVALSISPDGARVAHVRGPRHWQAIFGNADDR
jgi:tRNA threonylcarbamoyl adenosine modification protein YjeE